MPTTRPRARVRLMDGMALKAAIDLLGPPTAGTVPGRGGYNSRSVTPAHAALPFCRQPSDPIAVAHELFAVLRRLDASGAPLIWIETPTPPIPLGKVWRTAFNVLRRLDQAACGALLNHVFAGWT